MTDCEHCLDDILWRIRERPGLFLASPNITCLSSFITGFLLGRSTKNAFEVRFSTGFDSWIQENFKTGKTPHGWRHIIQYYSADEYEAFNQFFDLLDKFEADFSHSKKH